ncbi:MAG: lamin tail domain-containing protein [Planctomycetales bacterium]|nr:lamin tail domain-containing protein [Planctomycetales bacterium]
MRRRTVNKQRSFHAETLEARVLLAGDLVAHWQADDLVSSTADGATVGAWVDRVAIRPASNVAGSPILQYASLDGRASVRFDSTDGGDLLEVPFNANPIAGATDYSLIVVLSTSAQQFRDDGALWYQKTGIVDGNQNGFGADYGTALNANAQIVAGTSVGFLKPGAGVTSLSGNLNDGERHVYAFTRSGDSVSLYVDSDAPVSATGAGADAQASSVVLAIGGLATREGAFTGNISEVRVYDGQLTAAELASVMSNIDAYYNNAAPQAANDAYSVSEDSNGLLVNTANGLLSNDTDADGDPLTAQLATQPQHGQLSLQPNGSFLYIPDADYFGEDSFTYSAFDSRPSATATVTINVTPVNDAPTASPDAYFGDLGEPIVAELAAGLLANDSDIDSASLSAVVVAGPTNGTLDLNPNGTFIYTPNEGFDGLDVFTYRADDGTDQSDPVEVSLFVGGAPLRINEILAVNIGDVETRLRAEPDDRFRGDRLTPDWIEIQNLSSAAIDVSGFHLTDSRSDPKKWAFPAGTTIPANETLVVFASRMNVSDPRLDEVGLLHTNFVLTIGGEYLGITDPDGEVVDEFASGYPKQYPGISYGWTSDGELKHLTTATRGDAANGDGYTGAVSDTSFSIDRGFYSEPIFVEISTDDAEAQIKYTIDGTEPSAENGIVYSSPITISSTTTLRAAAFIDGMIPSNVDTQTYIYIGDVLKQSATPTVGPTGSEVQFPDAWRSQASDYEMDPEILSDPAYSDQFESALTALPSLSLTVPEMFERNGLYSNPGGATEQSASAELIFADGTVGFQVNAGARMQGGASRNAEHLKHSMSLRFREDYGETQLDYPLFAESAVSQFESIHLRARYNNSWIHWDQGQRNRGMLMREMFMRDSMLASGQVAAGHGRYVHLYLNGLYWGIYEMHERQDASHYAAYYGGQSYEYAASNANAIVDGTNTNALRDLTDVVRSGDWDAIQKNLDVDNHIVFNIVQEYGGNQDLKADGNWRAAGGGTAEAPWQFYVWDAERVLENVRQRGTSPVADLMNFVRTLDDIEEYVVKFGDHIHRLLFNDGALTPEKVTERWMYQFEQLEPAIVAESARWGDARPDRGQRTPLTKNDHWLPEHERIINQYFPDRTANVIDNFRRRNLYPGTNAPEFLVGGERQHGGTIDGKPLTVLNPDGVGTVYYTLDGSDPREVGGAVSANALIYSGDINLLDSTTVKMRLLNAGEWSALSEATFVIEQLADATNLRISEINYHPHNARAGEPDVGDSQFEFIEVMNVSDNVVNLSGAKFIPVSIDGNAEGIQFVFGNQVLQPQQRVVVARDVESLKGRYGDDVALAIGNDGLASPQGQWAGGRLGDGGETLTLIDASGEMIQQLRYDDAGRWAERADGIGSTLEYLGGTLDPADGQSWQASIQIGGTPGAAPTAFEPTVVINEVLSNSDDPAVDQIELYNVSVSDIDLSGYLLSDSANDFARYALPQGTSIAAGGYLALSQTDFGFGLKGDESDEVWLVSPNENGLPAAFVDNVSFGATEPNTTLGRWPNGTGELFPTSASSIGAVNSGPAMPNVVISEVHYNPAAADAATSDALEFVELFNSTAEPIDLSGWRLNKAVDYTFPEATELMAGESVVVVSFDPAVETQLAASFRANYGVGGQVRIVGPFSGVLDNGGERLELDRPTGIEGSNGHILVDRVRYDDDAPWTSVPDGNGPSLTRLDASAYGNDASSWIGIPPTPGTVNFDPPAVDLNDDGVVNADDITVLCTSLHSGGTPYDLDGNGNFNIDDFHFLVRGYLGTDAGDANLDRVFNSSDLVVVFTAGEYEDGIPLNSTWAEGDWNCDGEFDTSDLVAAFQTATYTAALKPIDGHKLAAATVDGTPGANDRNIESHQANEPDETQMKKPELMLVSNVDQIFKEVPDFEMDDDDIDDTMI